MRSYVRGEREGRVEADLWWLGLKATITEGGVWRIRRRERSPVIEVFKLEEAGYGDILLPAFVEWRTKGGSGDAGNAIGNAGDKPTVDGE